MEEKERKEYLKFLSEGTLKVYICPRCGMTYLLGPDNTDFTCCICGEYIEYLRDADMNDISD